MRKGTVKEFDEKQGFGFIHDEINDADYFVFFTAIQESGFKVLQPGQPVLFQLAMGKKGPQAINVMQQPLTD